MYQSIIMITDKKASGLKGAGAFNSARVSIKEHLYGSIKLVWIFVRDKGYLQL